MCDGGNHEHKNFAMTLESHLNRWEGARMRNPHKNRTMVRQRIVVNFGEVNIQKVGSKSGFCCQ